MLTLTWLLCSICGLCDRAGSAVGAVQAQHPAEGLHH